MVASRLEFGQELFDLLAGRKYDAACRLLESAKGEISSGPDRDEDRGLELSLPLSIALTGFEAWSQRRELLSKHSLSWFLDQMAATVPYYQRFARKASEAAIRLDAFPLTTRSSIIRDYDRFLSASLAGEPYKTFKATSGTTGKPLIIWYDLASFYDLCYYAFEKLADVVPGLAAAIAPGGPAGFVVTDHSLAWRASTVLPSLRLGRLVRRVLTGEPEADRRLVRDIRAASPRLLTGTASSLAALADLDGELAAGRAISPLAIFVSGENLFEEDRRRLEDWFGCTVYNAYISSEGGLMAMECGNGTGLHVSEERVRLEILAPNGTLANSGSGEIILTNLMNWALPFIRYRTGDWGTIRDVRCPCGFVGPTLVSLLGREAVRFTAGEREIDPRSLDSVLQRLPMKRYAIVQEAEARFEASWVPARPNVSSESIEAAVTALLCERLGKVELTFRRVERLNQPGQKAKRYLNRLESMPEPRP